LGFESTGSAAAVNSAVRSWLGCGCKKKQKHGDWNLEYWILKLKPPLNHHWNRKQKKSDHSDSGWSIFYVL
jgi:hypothetical protein